MRRFLLGIGVGVLAILGVRLVVAEPERPPHFHANWAVYVDGERLDLSADRYMEEVGACVVGEEVRPTDRVHLHDNNDDVVHVHHAGVTWGHLMTNLGFGLGEDYLILDEARRYFEGDGRSLKFILNGMAVPSAHDRLIRSGDRLLVSWGPESAEEVAATQFPTVASDAEEYNAAPDPGACRGVEEATFLERLRHAILG